MSNDNSDKPYRSRHDLGYHSEFSMKLFTGVLAEMMKMWFFRRPVQR